MTVEEVYFISQIVAAIAIVASLIFVGMQMRAQTRETRYSVMNQILTDYQQVMQSMAADPTFALDFFAAGNGGFEAIAPERRPAFVYQLAVTLRLYERAFIQRAAGRVADDAWDVIHRSLVPFLSSKGVKEFWQLRRAIFTPAFAAFVDKEIAKAESFAYPQAFSAPTVASGEHRPANPGETQP
jgi:hypothetical protein